MKLRDPETKQAFKSELQNRFESLFVQEEEEEEEYVRNVNGNGREQAKDNNNNNNIKNKHIPTGAFQCSIT